jgi:hypothetical protein
MTEPRDRSIRVVNLNRMNNPLALCCMRYGTGHHPAFSVRGCLSWLDDRHSKLPTELAPSDQIITHGIRVTITGAPCLGTSSTPLLRGLPCVRVHGRRYDTGAEGVLELPPAVRIPVYLPSQDPVILPGNPPE